MATKRPMGKMAGVPGTEHGLRLAVQRLAKLAKAPRVTDLYYMMDVDGYGEGYLSVYAILDDRDADPLPSRAQLARIERVIRDSLKEHVEYWVSISFRSHAEQEREMKRKDMIIMPYRVAAA